MEPSANFTPDVDAIAIVIANYTCYHLDKSQNKFKMQRTALNARSLSQSSVPSNIGRSHPLPGSIRVNPLRKHGAVGGYACSSTRASRTASTAAMSRTRVVQVQARSGSYRSSPEITDRILGALPYILPFMNAFVYARFLYSTVPMVRMALQPVMPAIISYSSMPFASLIAFFGLYLGVINNKNLSRFVRFNGMQALLLDIGLILPRLMENVISPPTSGWGVQLYANSQSFIWIFITMWVVYGMFNSLIGQYGRIPFIAESADQQIS